MSSAESMPSGEGYSNCDRRVRRSNGTGKDLETFWLELFHSNNSTLEKVVSYVICC